MASNDGRPLDSVDLGTLCDVPELPGVAYTGLTLNVFLAGRHLEHLELPACVTHPLSEGGAIQGASIKLTLATVTSPPDFPRVVVQGACP